MNVSNESRPEGRPPRRRNRGQRTNRLPRTNHNKGIRGKKKLRVQKPDGTWWIPTKAALEEEKTNEELEQVDTVENQERNEGNVAVSNVSFSADGNLSFC